MTRRGTEFRLMNQQSAGDRLPRPESPRIRRFRIGLAKAIPRFPNDRKSLQHLEQKNLRDVLIDFVNWRSRYVGVRQRNVMVYSAADTDLWWTSLTAEINLFLEKVRHGEDLTPHLSVKPHTRGFTPAALARGASSEDKWLDKDFALTAHGFHHFHIGVSFESPGQVKQSDDLLFAHVTRDSFTVIGVFNHSVFDCSSAEHHRLRVLHDQYASRNVPRGCVVIGTSIATSGHSMHVVRYAQRCARTIFDVDPKLDDHDYIERLYEMAGRAAPDKLKLAWGFDHLDLGVADMRSSVLFALTRAWN